MSERSEVRVELSEQKRKIGVCNKPTATTFLRRERTANLVKSEREGTGHKDLLVDLSRRF